MRTRTRQATIRVVSVGAEIKARREGLGLNQTETARRLRMDRSRLSHIECDRSTIKVTAAEARRFHRVLGLPLEVWA